MSDKLTRDEVQNICRLVLRSQANDIAKTPGKGGVILPRVLELLRPYAAAGYLKIDETEPLPIFEKSECQVTGIAWVWLTPKGQLALELP